MLKKYSFPGGLLYINQGRIVEHIVDNGIPVSIPPGEYYITGDLKGVPLEEYFACREVWEAKQEIKSLLDKEKEIKVLFDVHNIKKYGDLIMMTIFPKAFRETWGEKVEISVWVDKDFKAIWENNPFVDSLITEEPSTSDYHKVIDLTKFGIRFRSRAKEKTSVDAIIQAMGLTLVNKTPVLSLTDSELCWAEKELKKLGLFPVPGDNRALVGVVLGASVKSRTYSRIGDVIKKLRDEGHKVIVLDKRSRGGKFTYSIRQVASLINYCDVIVSPDSGLLHVAGALKRRIVGLFGHTEGKVFTETYEKASYIQGVCPYGEEPCYWELSCLPGEDYHSKADISSVGCLESIHPQQVVGEVERQLLSAKKLLLVMLTYNCLDMTKTSLESIRSKHDYEIFIVDNESEDGTVAWLQEKGYNFVSKKTSVAEAQNIGIEKFLEGDYDYLIFLNNDIVLRYDALDALVECAEKSGAWGVMCTETSRKYNIDSIQVKEEGWEEIIDIPAGSYSATLFSREAIERVGFFNERFTPRYIEDNDYTLRLRALGGKFVRAKKALFWHYLGAVIKKVEKTTEVEKKKYWFDNIEIFREMYGFSPHESQSLSKLGEEWRRGRLVSEIDKLLKRRQPVSVKVIRRMGGYGDILFTTVVAKALKRKYGDRVKVFYAVPERFREVLENNTNIDRLCDYDKVADLSVDLTDLEFRVELQEMGAIGKIVSSRTEIYLDVLGLPKDDLKPDYFLKKEEIILGREFWKNFGNKKRVIVIPKGSNKLKIWPDFDEFIRRLDKQKFAVVVLEEGKFTFRQVAALVSQANIVV